MLALQVSHRMNEQLERLRFYFKFLLWRSRIDFCTSGRKTRFGCRDRNSTVLVGDPRSRPKIEKRRQIKFCFHRFV
jgi:hypothetical protein